MLPLDPAGGEINAPEIVQLLAPIMPEKNRKEYAERHDTDFVVVADARGEARLHRAGYRFGGQPRHVTGTRRA